METTETRAEKVEIWADYQGAFAVLGKDCNGKNLSLLEFDEVLNGNHPLPCRKLNGRQEEYQVNAAYKSF